jgi:hypothetical protein
MERQTMDHDYAVKSEACEKYLLGELSAELREAYEDHYFSCAECAVQLRSAVEMFGASRQILAEQPAVAAEPVAVPLRAGWFDWLRPAFAAPVLAALLLLVGYQNFVTIPLLKQSASPRVMQMFTLITANSRGDAALEVIATPNQPLGLYVDMPLDRVYSAYHLQLQDPAGKVTPLRSVDEEEAQKTVVVAINSGITPGVYTLVISGQPKSGDPAKELARIHFTITFSPQVQQH